MRLAMALYGDLSHDSRVIREAESLAAAGHAVTITCLAASDEIIAKLGSTVRVIVRQPPGRHGRPGAGSPFLGRRSSRLRALASRAAWLFRYQRALGRWGRLVVAAAGPVDAWHAHDLTGLQAIAPHVARPIPIIYDSHELFLETGSAVFLPGLARRWLRARERSLIRRSVAVVTVNPGIAAEIERHYHPARIEIVRNCLPQWTPPATRPNLIRQAIGLADAGPIVLFHGSGSSPIRGIEQLIDALDDPSLSDVHFVLVGYGEWQESPRDQVSRSALGGPPARAPGGFADRSPGVGRIGLTSVPCSSSRPTSISSCRRRTSCSRRSRSARRSSPPTCQEYARIVRDDPDGPLGVLCDPVDVGAIVAALRTLLEPPGGRLVEMRERCLRAAGARLNWGVEASHLVDLYADLARGPGVQRDRDI